MSVIKVMSENLANKIAAGEVVEKCSSAVKELVENSIDAHAKNIKIELIKGGLTEITVIDDGHGMDEEDALMCFMRHATSKIYKDDDLFFIDTLGFRGEALPSIASVSEVVLETCKKDVGTYVHIKGGEVLEKKLGSARIGTKITITNLFYNTPARLKYLKSEQSELSSIVNFIEKLSLAKPNIAFSLTNNGKTLIKSSGSNNLLKCIHEIYGGSISKNCLEVKALDDDFEISGYVCKPDVLKSHRNNIVTFVNGRVIKNNDIFRAINDAYYTYKPDGKYPVVILNVDTDPTLVDVNIHPTKQDVKISKSEALYNLIYNTIKNVLYNNLLIPDAIKNNEEIKKEEVNIISDNLYTLEDSFSNKKIDQYHEEKVQEEVIVQTTFDFGDTNETVKNEELKSLVLYPVGLCLGTYIVCENDEGIFLVDQHAAQERINYENYLSNLKNEEVVVTGMLIPLTIELSPSEYIDFLAHQDIFTNLGFSYEEFGINTIVVKEHPTWLKVGYEEESIRKIIDLILKLNKDFDVIKFRENVAITLACKMAIKANEHISLMQIEELLKNLVKCDNPYNCPHGRPTIIKFSLYDLEKMFKRAMS